MRKGQGGKTVIYTELTALKGLIREKNTSYAKLSEIVGIAINTFSDKMNGYSVFSATEMSGIADELDIAPEHMVQYFFPRMLRSSTNSRT